MSLRTFRILGFALIFLVIGRGTNAQTKGFDTLLMGGIVVGTDTFPMAWLPDFQVIAKLPRRFRRQQIRYDRLRYNVYKTYPYALIAAEILRDVDEHLLLYSEDPKARKQYLRQLEEELKAQFKGELENLTISQGQVLVKLINRETGKPCFHIIKELKGGFSAVVWQSLALLFQNNLKREYDPTGKDQDIEKIVLEIEAQIGYGYRKPISRD